MAETKSGDLDEPCLRRVDVELFIVHPTMSPVEITAALGLEPLFAHRVGDQRKTPRGDMLTGRHQDTRWRHSRRYEVRDQLFGDKVTALVDTLLEHKGFFVQLRATGGEAQVIVHSWEMATWVTASPAKRFRKWPIYSWTLGSNALPCPRLDATCKGGLSSADITSASRHKRIYASSAQRLSERGYSRDA
jgi:hypothetical protein